MATRRTQIIDALQAHLLAIPSIEQVFKSYRYLDEINDWPSITFVPRGEIRDHRGAGHRVVAARTRRGPQELRAVTLDHP